MTTDMTRFNTFQELRSMNKALDQMIHGSARWPRVLREDVELSAFDQTLPVDIFEQGNEIVVKAALPGVDPKDVDVRIHDGVLQIAAETKRDKDVEESHYHRREYRYGKWSRSFRLPTDVVGDKAKASFDNGMLRLRIPRASGSQPRSLKIVVK